jgi:tripartite-type tricarboxylate transporter receptor subunit TctC
MTCFIASAFAETWPARPIRFLVPFAPGGGGDVVGRIIGQRMSEQLGKPLVIDNRAGGGGTLGCEIAAKATPDGYTLLLGNVGPIAVGPALYPKLAYDPVRDFAPVTMIASFPNLLVANPGLPFKSVPELVAYAKARPGKLNFASAGAGTSTHLAGELFKSVAGIDVVHVPYKGGAAAMMDIIAGQVAYYFGTMPSSLPLSKAGKLRALGVTSLKRSDAIPEVPTISESALPGYEAVTWWGIFAPARTPREIVNKIHADTVKALQMPDTLDKLAREGVNPAGSTPEQFATMIQDEMVKMAKIVKAANMKID